MTSTFKINHDSLWVKLTATDKSWGKVRIGRNGTKFTASSQTMLDKTIAAFDATSGSYGERIQAVAASV
mgnify:CR=1 FL=1|tara:strand:- start:1750 stop:1956 length:207 start_codon:yes stop_codon:yes gene_type:complete